MLTRIFFTVWLFCVLLNKADAQFIAAPSTSVELNTDVNFIKIPGGYLGVKSYLQPKGNLRWPKDRYSVSIVQYDDKMNFVKERKLADGDFSFNRFVPKLIMTDKLWAVYPDPGHKYNLGSIQATQIDTATLMPLPSKTIATEQEIDIVAGLYEQFDMRFRESPNHKYHCLFISNGHDDDFFLACLDSELKPVWKGKQSIPKTYYFEINNIAIDNDGTIFLTSVRKNVATLSRFGLNGAVVNQPLDFGERTPQFVDIIAGQGGEVYAGGTLENRSDVVTSVFLTKVEKNGSLAGMKELDIPDSIIARAKKDGFVKKSGLLGGNFLQPELTQQGDGTIKLAMECKSFILGRMDGEFGTLIIADFGAAKNQFSMIPKHSVRPWPIRSTNQFIIKPLQNNVILFYYDNADNLNRSLDDPQKMLSGASNAALFATIIDNNGNIKRYEVTHNATSTPAEMINAFIANNL